MKILIVVSFALLNSLAQAQETPALAFTNTRIEFPPLSLIESAKQKMPSPFGNPAIPFRSARRPSIRSSRPLSQMPIVVPSDDVDYKLRVATPDESTDYKMIVIGSDTLPAK